MDLSTRYEILDTIASGDFATVLRARDRELGREVAIKQIHQQFLADQQQLARYWREAQLLASLQHPNILTIYDIVRPRGWLILELMQGSLKERAAGEPLDLDSLRIVLTAGLNALHFLHNNSVLHGDVKPGNLLFDAQNRIKLGDFGLARRASSEEGSLLKGTTKYMAPELVSEKFGVVGSASDLYSLGFSVYELMCGSRFESLFPGLGTFGRDKQIAWMMWHAAPDRKLPEISKVLEGVPDDLARVIQKLVAKDQARRYQAAQDVLRDLTVGPPPVDHAVEEEEAEALAASAAAAKKKRRLRLVAMSAVVVSAIFCGAILFWPGGREPPRMPRGVITEVFPDEWKLVLASRDGSARELSFTRHDRFFVNGEPATNWLRDVRPGDQVIVKRVRDEQGRWITEVHATRPRISSGLVKTITGPDQADQADQGQFVLTLEQVDKQDTELTVSVPQTTEILFNGQKRIAGRPVELADLKPGDRVRVHHVADRPSGGTSAMPHRWQGRRAVKLTAERLITGVVGIVRSVEGTRGGGVSHPQIPARPTRLTVLLSEGADETVRVFPFTDDCKVTINGLPFKAPTDLKQGDRVTFDHDSRVVNISAQRILRHLGEAKSVHTDRLVVMLRDRSEPVTCVIGPKCKITIAGEPAELADLRADDKLEIAHDSFDLKNVRPIEVAAERLPDPTRWAILVGIQDYEDGSLTRLAFPVADAKLLRDTLVNRYWTADKQALLLTDENLQRLKSQISKQLARIPAAASLLVYFAAHAYQDEQGQVYLAPKDFRLARMSTTGLGLQWLVDELEMCPAGEKLLLLDCSHAGKGEDLKKQPSTAEMLAALEGRSGWAPLRTVTAVASCSPGQRGLVWDQKGHGLFAWCLARGYAGSADEDRDKRIRPTELAALLKQRMASLGKQLEGTQAPTLVEADNRPPRLDEEAKKAIYQLAEHFQSRKIDFDTVDLQFAAAAEAAGAEPEPKLLYGLLLLKGKWRQPARDQFAELKFEHPDWLIPVQGTAWAWFEERGYTAGLSELRELVIKIPKPRGAGQPYPQQIGRLFTWAGRLRQFAEITTERGARFQPQSLAGLDAAVETHGEPAQALYDRGRQQARERKQEIERQAADAKKSGNLARVTQLLTVDRYLLKEYLTFPFDAALRQIIDGLDRRVPRY